MTVSRRPCLRCGQLAERGSYCSQHSKRTVHGRKWNGWAWSKLRARIVARDGHCCTVPDCWELERLEVDHIVPLQDGGTDHPDNLRTLCHEHHMEAGGTK